MCVRAWSSQGLQGCFPVSEAVNTCNIVRRLVYFPVLETNSFCRGQEAVPPSPPTESLRSRLRSRSQQGTRWRCVFFRRVRLEVPGTCPECGSVVFPQEAPPRSIAPT